MVRYLSARPEGGTRDHRECREWPSLRMHAAHVNLLVGPRPCCDVRRWEGPAGAVFGSQSLQQALQRCWLFGMAARAGMGWPHRSTVAGRGMAWHGMALHSIHPQRRNLALSNHQQDNSINLAPELTCIPTVFRTRLNSEHRALQRPMP